MIGWIFWQDIWGQLELFARPEYTYPDLVKKRRARPSRWRALFYGILQRLAGRIDSENNLPILDTDTKRGRTCSGRSAILNTRTALAVAVFVAVCATLGTVVEPSTLASLGTVVSRHLVSFWDNYPVDSSALKLAYFLKKSRMTGLRRPKPKSQPWG